MPGVHGLRPSVRTSRSEHGIAPNQTNMHTDRQRIKAIGLQTEGRPVYTQSSGPMTRYMHNRFNVFMSNADGEGASMPEADVD